MILKKYIEFIKEYTVIDGPRTNMLKKLKKKLGARNVNDEIHYRDPDRPRSPMQINWNMFDSMYISAAQDDYSMVDDENWKYVWSRIGSYRISHNEKGRDFIKHMIETYKPSEEEITKLFSRTVGGNPNPVTEYLLPMIDKKELKNMVREVMPYGLGYSSDSGPKAILFYKLGLFKFEGEPGPEDNLIYGTVSQSMLPKFLGYSMLDSIAKEAMSKDGFEWDDSFFETIVKHPNNGGINSSESRFKRELEWLSKLESFRNYLITHPSLIDLEAGWRKEGSGKNTLFDFLPEEIQKDERIQNYARSKSGVDRFKL